MKYHISLLQEWSLWCLSEHNGNSWTSNLISCKCHQTLNQALENFKAVGVGNSRFTKRGHIIVTLRLEKGLSLVMVTAPRDSISAARNSLLLQLHHPILNCRVLKDWKKLWRGTSVQPHSNIPSCGSPPPFSRFCREQTENNVCSERKGTCLSKNTVARALWPPSTSSRISYKRC